MRGAIWKEVVSYRTYLKHDEMTKKAYRKMIAGHLQWSLVGLVVAMFVAFISSDHRLVVYGIPGSGTEALESIAPLTSTAPASAPEKLYVPVVPDTIDGALVWPDPWDKITGYPQLNY